MKMKVRYLKPETDIVKVQVDRILTETSVNYGNGTSIPIVDENPEDGDEDNYGQGGSAKFDGGVGIWE